MTYNSLTKFQQQSQSSQIFSKTPFGLQENAPTTLLKIDRALTPDNRRNILDTADLLLEIGGRSKAQNRYNRTGQLKRKGYRPYRNRAIIYILIETGMRRQDVTHLNVDSIDWEKKSFTIEEKGSRIHSYYTSNNCLQAIQDYLLKERSQDMDKWKSSALFLAPFTTPHGNGRLSVRTINEIWNAICKTAGVEGKTPHSARHAMGKFIIEKTGNPAAVQKQLGHKSPLYSLQYAKSSGEDLGHILNDR